MPTSIKELSRCLWFVTVVPCGSLNSHQIQTKNRQVCENAVTGIWGSCWLLVMGSWPHPIIVNYPLSSQLTKIKTMLKLFWPLLIVNLKIPGLIWRGTAYFVQNNTTIILPGDTRRTSSELPCRTPATHFWRQIRSLETQNVSYFSLFTIWYGFWNCKSLFVNI